MSPIGFIAPPLSLPMLCFAKSRAEKYSSGSAFIIKRSSYTKSNTEAANLEGDAPDKKDSDDANLLNTVEGNPETAIDLPNPDTHATDNHLPVESPLNEQVQDEMGLEDLDDLEDLESLSDKPSDEIAKALEDLADEYRDKITVLLAYLLAYGV